MLVLTRRPDEEIEIGPDIRIRICDVRGNKVRVGIEAPREVRIVRVPPTKVEPAAEKP